VNPDSPLGVSKKGEYQDVELRLWRADGIYRKTTSVLVLGGSLLVSAGAPFLISCRPSDVS